VKIIKYEENGESKEFEIPQAAFDKIFNTGHSAGNGAASALFDERIKKNLGEYINPESKNLKETLLSLQSSIDGLKEKANDNPDVNKDDLMELKKQLALLSEEKDQVIASAKLELSKSGVMGDVKSRIMAAGLKDSFKSDLDYYLNKSYQLEQDGNGAMVFMENGQPVLTNGAAAGADHIAAQFIEKNQELFQQRKAGIGGLELNGGSSKSLDLQSPVDDLLEAGLIEIGVK